MDGIKRPVRSKKIPRNRKSGGDETLVNLYKDSEFTKENATPKEELADENVDEDISAFINNEEDKVDETKVPVKQSVKQKRKKEAIKAKKAAGAKKVIGRIIFYTILVALIVLGALYVFMPNLSESINGTFEQTVAEADEIYYSPLTGLETKDKNVATAATTCIMIENSTDARPQSGLNQAGVVYEAIAEGGITRFMAVFQEAKPNLVGPIRSARKSFVDLAKQYQCTYLHVGGAKNAIDELKNGYRDSGWPTEGTYVFRSSNSRHRNIVPYMPRGRYAPHDVYTTFEHIGKFQHVKGWTNSTFSGFPRIQPDYRTPVDEITARTIKITMAGDAKYNPVYTYDQTNNRYLRAHANGGAHNSLNSDGSQTQNAPTVVIAMKVNAIARSSEPKYKDYVSVGSGEAHVFQDGIVTHGKWTRSSVNDPLKFLDDNNEEIKLNRGQVWISLYPSGTGNVSYSK